MIAPDLLPALHNFAAVARHGSFRAAARHLGVSPSAISHAVSTLERRLGMQLLTRTTRSVALTPEGKTVLEGLDPGLKQIEQALDAARNLTRSVAGDVRITVPRSVAEFLVLPLTLSFTRTYPQITLEMHADDALQDIVAGRFDCGIRFGNMLEQDMITTAIGPETRVVVVASPDYVRQNGAPDHPKDLLRHRCLGRRFASGTLFAWTFTRGHDQLNITPPAALIFNDDLLVRRAALAGAGIGFAFEQLVRSDLASGRLIEVLPEWADDPERCYLYWPRNHVMRPAVRAFIDFARNFRDEITYSRLVREGGHG